MLTRGIEVEGLTRARRVPSLPHIPELAPGRHISLAANLSEIAVLAPDWLALEEAAAKPFNVFQSYLWCRSWARTYGAQGAIEPHIVTGYDDKRLVFLMPLMKVRSGPLGILRWLSEPFGQYGDVLCAPDQCPERWLKAALAFAGRLKGVDALRLRHVRQDARIYPALARMFRHAQVRDGAPYLDLKRFPDERAYEKRYSKEQRRRRKRIRKTLEERGPVEFRLLAHGPESESEMRRALREKRKWIAERNLWSRALRCPALAGLLAELAQGGQAVTSILSCGGEAVSWEIGLRYRGRHFGFITAHDTRFTGNSPARLHMDLSQRRAIADGMEAFDLMIPLDRHKESWSSDAMPVHDFHQPITRLGRLYGAVYLERLRPLARQAYYSASPSLRRAVAGMKVFLPI